MVYSALKVAQYFLSIPDDDAGERVSNLKLQKLLYYSQGYHVATYGVDTPLFVDKLYAWKHGPVVKTVYDNYSSCGNNPLPAGKVPNFDNKTIAFLNEVYRVFGRYSAWVLRDMTHKETPWLKNYKADVKNIEISWNDLYEYFHSNVKKQKRA
jgi:uncharacterized phage-associated protein